MMPTRIYAQENMSLSALKFSRASFHSLNICHKNCFFWAAPAPPTTSNLFYYWTIITSVPSHVANHSPTSCSHVAYSTHAHTHIRIHRKYIYIPKINNIQSQGPQFQPIIQIKMDFRECLTGPCSGSRAFIQFPMQVCICRPCKLQHLNGNWIKYHVFRKFSQIISTNQETQQQFV